MIRQVRIGDIMRLKRRAVTIDPLSEYTLIGVYSFGKGIFHREPALGAELGSYRFFGIEPGDLVISNIQAWEGAIAFATQREEGSIGTHRFLTYVPVDGSVDANYLRYYLLSEPGHSLIRQASPGSVTRNRTLAIDRFENLLIPLPDFSEQRRIVAELEWVAERRGAAAGLTDRTRKLTNALPAALAHRGGVADSIRPALGWREARLGDLMSLAAEAFPVEIDRSYPNVGIYSFGRGLFAKVPIDGAFTSAKTLYRIRAGQFIYSRLFAFEGAYAAVDERFDGHFVSNEFPVFDLDEGRIDVRFLAAYFTSPAVWEELSASSKGLGLRRQRVHPDRLLEHRIWLPPLEEQRAIGRTLDRVRRIGELRTVMRERLSALETSVLNRAFAGQL